MGGWVTLPSRQPLSSISLARVSMPAAAAAATEEEEEVEEEEGRVA